MRACACVLRTKRGKGLAGGVDVVGEAAFAAHQGRVFDAAHGLAAAEAHHGGVDGAFIGLSPCITVGRLAHRGDDVDVAGAAAQVAFQRMRDLRVAGLRVLGQQAAGAHHHARRAEPALQAVAGDEGLLHRVQRATGRGQPLHRGDAAAGGLQRQHAAALDGLAVQQHGAGAALAGVAADMGAGQRQRAAQQLDQQGGGIDRGLHGLAVDGEGEGCAHGGSDATGCSCETP